MDIARRRHCRAEGFKKENRAAVASRRVQRAISIWDSKTSADSEDAIPSTSPTSVVPANPAFCVCQLGAHPGFCYELSLLRRTYKAS